MFLLGTSAVASATEKPNIIFILTDDLGYGDVGYAWQGARPTNSARIYTPNIDALAKEGVILSSHYCAAPVCAPSRASILTGKLQKRGEGGCSLQNNNFDHPITEADTLATVLTNANYHTMAIGKWGIGGGGQSGVDVTAHPFDKGFNRYYGFMDHMAGHTYYHYDGTRSNAYMGLWEGRDKVPVTTDENGEQVGDGIGIYSTDLFFARAKKDIAAAISDDDTKDKPFFLYFAVNTIHGSGASDLNPTISNEASLHIPGRAYPAAGVEWDSLIANPESKADRNSWFDPRYSDTSIYTNESMRRYATAISRLDDAMLDLMNFLEEKGIADNTIIIFTSDNGPTNEYGTNVAYFESTGPFDGMKRDVYEGGLRVPTFVWKKGGFGVKEDATPSISTDWMATIADLGGATAFVPADRTGVSLLPRWETPTEGAAAPTASTIHVAYNYNGSSSLNGFAARKKGLVGGEQVMWREGDYVTLRAGGTDKPYRKYNVVTDPHQDNDIMPGTLAVGEAEIVSFSSTDNTKSQTELQVGGVFAGTLSAACVTTTGAGNADYGLFHTGGAIGGNTGTFTPNVNIGEGGTWSVTFTAAEAFELPLLQLTAKTFNSSGGNQVNNNRYADFTLTHGTTTWTASDVQITGNGAAVPIRLSGEQVLQVAKGDTLTLTCARGTTNPTSQGGTYIGLTQLQIGEGPVTMELPESGVYKWSEITDKTSDRVTLHATGNVVLEVDTPVRLDSLTVIGTTASTYTGVDSVTLNVPAGTAFEATTQTGEITITETAAPDPDPEPAVDKTFVFQDEWKANLSHWTQYDDTSYNTYTPSSEVDGKEKHAYAGCTAVAGATVLQFFNVASGPDGVTKTCRFNGAETELTTMGGAYNWNDLKGSDVRARALYDLGVCSEMKYNNAVGQASIAWPAALNTALKTNFGFNCSEYICGPVHPNLIYNQLRSGAPVVLAVYPSSGNGYKSGGGHTITAMGYFEAADGTPKAYVFMGSSGAGDNWCALPNIASFNLLEDGVSGLAYGNDNAVALVGQVFDDAGRPVANKTVTITPNEGTATTVTTGEWGQYAARVSATPTAYTLSVDGYESRTVSLAYTKFPDKVDFRPGAAPTPLTVYTNAAEAKAAAEADDKLIFMLTGRDGLGWTHHIMDLLEEMGSDFSDHYVFYYDIQSETKAVACKTFQPNAFTLSDEGVVAGVSIKDISGLNYNKVNVDAVKAQVQSDVILASLEDDFPGFVTTESSKSVTFSGGGDADTITANGLLAGTIDNTKLTTTGSFAGSATFHTTGNAIVSGYTDKTTYFKPNINVGNGNPWAVTFTADQNIELTKLTLKAFAFNLSGATQYSNRSATFTCTFAGETEPAWTKDITFTGSGAATTVSPTAVELTGDAKTIQKGQTITITCSRISTDGFFAGLVGIDLLTCEPVTAWSQLDGASDVVLTVTGNAALQMDDDVEISSLTIKGADDSTLTFLGEKSLKADTTVINSTIDVSGIAANLGAATVAEGATLNIGANTTITTLNGDESAVVVPETKTPAELGVTQGAFSSDDLKDKLPQAIRWAALTSGSTTDDSATLLNAMNFADATLSVPEAAYLLNCAVSDVEDEKAKFTVSDFTLENGAWVLKVAEKGDGDAYGNGTIEVESSSELDFTKNDATRPQRFFRAKLVP